MDGLRSRRVSYHEMGRDERNPEIRLTFESNFAYPIRVTMAPLRQAQQRNGVPEELVKDVKIELYREGKKTGEAFVKDNYQRLCSVESVMYRQTRFV